MPPNVKEFFLPLLLLIMAVHVNCIHSHLPPKLFLWEQSLLAFSAMVHIFGIFTRLWSTLKTWTIIKKNSNDKFHGIGCSPSKIFKMNNVCPESRWGREGSQAIVVVNRKPTGYFSTLIIKIQAWFFWFQNAGVEPSHLCLLFSFKIEREIHFQSARNVSSTLYQLYIKLQLCEISIRS